MLDITDELKALYNQDNIYKELVIYIPELDLTITNDQIVDKSFTLTESLCSNTDLTFGSCEAAMVEITVADVELDISNKTMIVTQIVNSTYEMPLGTYIINSALRQSDKRFKKITAFDYMTKTDIDISAWYNALTFPITVKSMRESLLTFIGVDYVSQTLTNDTVTLAKSINPSSLTARDILRRLCEINAGFGHITRDNKFKVIQLTGLGLYPSESLYPSEDLFPAESGVVIPTGSYRNIEYSEYIVEPITLLKIQQDDEDSGVTSGTGTNSYIISGNYLLFGKTGTELQAISDAIFLQIKNKYYRPHTTTIKGIPYIEVGDSVLTITTTDAIESFAFKRVMTGVHALVDTLSATGNQYRSQATSLSTQIQQLKGRTLVIKKSVDELSSTITDVSEDLQSQITQQAGEIELRVEKSGVIAAINLSPETAKIEAPNIQLEGIVTANNNFKVLLDGSIEAVNGKFTGDIISTNATITGGTFTQINSSNTQVAKISNGIFNGTSFTCYSFSDITGGISGTTGSTLTPGQLILFGPFGAITSITYDSLTTSDVTCTRINGSTPINTSNIGSHIPSTSGIEADVISSSYIQFSGGRAAGYNWCLDTFELKTPSDIRLKKNFKPMSELPLSLFFDIKAAQFEFIENDYEDGIIFGFYAQQIEESFKKYGYDPLEYNLIKLRKINKKTSEGKYVTDMVHTVNYKNFIAWEWDILQKICKKIDLKD